MEDWTAGYVAHIGYTYGYYPELNPLRVRLALLNAGLALPTVGSACELGFGQGLSINLHAAASEVNWRGTDFNPAQAGLAQEFAAIAGSGARLHEDAFADFARRDDLPDFEFIGLHGIWSWISDENRRVIVDFVARRLKPGGVLYISYNTLPGWATFAPMRHLLNEHAATISATGHGILSRIDSALDFAEKLLATQPAYARTNPQVAERLKSMKGKNRHYLAHEYFNRDWHPMHFATVSEWLRPAKLSFACSAHYLDYIDAINLTEDQQAFLRQLPDPTFRESVRDFMTNQQFRRDYWVKGTRRLSALEQVESVRRQRVVLLTRRADVTLKASGALGEATLSESIYGPVLDALADQRPQSLAQLEQAVRDKGVTLPQTLQAVLMLIGAGHLAAAQDEPVAAKAKRASERLNAHMMDKARGNGDIAFLASPLIGGGVVVPRFEQLFLLARAQGRRQPAEWAVFVWQVLEAQGQKIVKDGKPLNTAEDNLVELRAQAETFAEKRLPVLRALQVA